MDSWPSRRFGASASRNVKSHLDSALDDPSFSRPSGFRHRTRTVAPSVMSPTQAAPADAAPQAGALAAALALGSTDGELFASGGADKVVMVWRTKLDGCAPH